MKKWIIGLAVLAVAVATFATVNTAKAQSSQPAATSNTWTSGQRGRGGMGMMGGRGYAGNTSSNGSITSRAGVQAGSADGILHDYMAAALADKLGLSVEEIESRLDGGETMADIAVSLGVSLTDFRSMMVDIHSTAIDQAVADGAISQEQADWMESRPGMLGGGYSMMGGGFGGDCPYYNQN